MTPTPVEAEYLVLNVEEALNVRERSQFFLWTQGQLQSLLPHQLLVCSAGSSRAESSRLRTDVFSREPLAAEEAAALKADRGGCLSTLLDDWQRTGQTTRVSAPSSPGNGNGSLLGRKHLCLHGVVNAGGTVAGFFVLANERPYDPGRHIYFMEVLTPYLQLAFAATRLAAERDEDRAAPSAARLTERQLAVLRYMREGKSNAEIGGLLYISPLTVKNHVQTLLRKLNAQNRAQAVGFGITQRLIQPGLGLDPATEPETDPDDELQAEPEAELEAGPGTELGTEPDPEIEAGAETEPEASDSPRNEPNANGGDEHDPKVRH